MLILSASELRDVRKTTESLFIVESFLQTSLNLFTALRRSFPSLMLFNRIVKSSSFNALFREALSRWQEEVVQLDLVDPVTTEMVRLRCAEHHDCHT